MGHYKANLRDIEFNMFEVSDLGTHLAARRFGDFDEESVRHILREVERLATGTWADSFADGDRNPPELIDGEAKLPQSLKTSLDAG